MKPLEATTTQYSAVGQNLRGLAVLLRPKEWTKNLLLFTGLIFSRSLSNVDSLLTSLAAFAIFCAISSGIYIFNDLCDVEADRQHPIKSKRPLAAGLVNTNVARLVLLALLAGGALAALKLNYAFACAAAVYMVISLSYSLRLKHAVILDVLCISSGFVLRAVAGALALSVAISPWLVLCTSMAALLVGFGKRRNEIALLGEDAVLHRKSLVNYSIEFLDAMMNICAGSAIVTYALYTMSDETVARFGTHNLLLTLPFVVYGIFRYLFLIHKREEGGDPVQLLFRDWPSLLNLGLWIITVCLIIYLPSTGLSFNFLAGLK